jgi:hypothetical protein
MEKSFLENKKVTMNKSQIYERKYSTIYFLFHFLLAVGLILFFITPEKKKLSNRNWKKDLKLPKRVLSSVIINEEDERKE